MVHAGDCKVSRGTLIVTSPPENPLVFHITHVANLAAIASNGGLESDATMIARGGPTAGIGMSQIKQRRLSLPTCHPGDHVGDYVPFYFCPRSIMLYVIHCANSPNLAYRGGQEPIVHLVADLHSVVTWANQNGRRWAFSLSNAGAYYAKFRSALQDLGDVDWNAVAARDFRSASVREGKQAEFLLHGTFPWSLVSQIGVVSNSVASQARTAIQGIAHQPLINVQRSWYF